AAVPGRAHTLRPPPGGPARAAYDTSDRAPQEQRTGTGCRSRRHTPVHSRPGAGASGGTLPRTHAATPGYREGLRRHDEGDTTGWPAQACGAWTVCLYCTEGHVMSRNSHLYAEDFYPWTQTTAAAIRAGKWARIDREAVAAEIESLGVNQEGTLYSHLKQLAQ